MDDALAGRHPLQVTGANLAAVPAKVLVLKLALKLEGAGAAVRIGQRERACASFLLGPRPAYHVCDGLKAAVLRAGERRERRVMNICAARARM